MERRLLFVLGMHRCGTSALTRVLNCLGAEVGEDLLPPLEEENAGGFWEHREVVAANDALLADLTRPWYDFRPLPADWPAGPEADAARAKLSSILESMDWGRGLVVMKDPRLCRLLPLWRTVAEEAGVAAGAVLATREPAEVARSLFRRNRLDAACSHALYASYSLDAERNSRDLPRGAVDFGSLLRDWRAVADGLAGALDLRWPRSPDQAGAEIDAELRPDLRHERAEPGQTRERDALKEIAADLHEALASGDLLDHAAFDALRSRFEAVLAAGEPFVAMACENLRHQVEISDGLRRKARVAEERLGYLEDRVARVKDHWTWPILRKAARILGVSGFEKGPE